MISIDETIKNLNARGFDTSYFENGKAAVDYLATELNNE